MKLSELIAVLPFTVNSSAFNAVEVRAVETDSRKVKPGTLFICMRGYQTDGHLFVNEAVSNGAVAIIAEEKISTEVPIIQVTDTIRATAQIANKFYSYPTSKLPLIGITGTNGKTTVSYLLESIYRTYGTKTGVIGTIETKIGETTYQTNNTTPDALSLQKLFHQMNQEEVKQAIMEVSSHAIDLGRVYGSDFDTVIFTNLSQDHLDYHKTEENYFRVKSYLFAQLGNTYKGTDKFAVVNADDSHLDELKKATAQSIITYGIKNKADVSAEDMQLFPGRIIFRLKTPLGTVKITSRLTGEFNIYNMLAASAAAIANHVPLQTIKEAFELIEGVPGRFETVDAGQDYAVIVDYAHTPHALRNTLQTGKSLTTGKLYTVIGCGGERDQTKRPLMAMEAIQLADHTIFTTDNPRKEDPRNIILDMTINLDASRYNFEIEVDREKAIKKAIDYAQAGDIIIIAGKGHETYQEINGRSYPFDDRVVARNAIIA